MRHLRKATLALPALLIALGLAIPAVVGGRGSKLDVAPRVEQARYAGRTAGEWYALAMASLEGDEFGLALRYLKTAERVDAGSQYVSELHRVRRAGRRARDIEANRRRMLDGELRGLELDETGTVLTAHRSTRRFPGRASGLWRRDSSRPGGASRPPNSTPATATSTRRGTP